MKEKNKFFSSFLPATHKTAAVGVNIFEKDHTLPTWKDLAHHFKIEENNMLEHSVGFSIAEKLHLPRSGSPGFSRGAKSSLSSFQYTTGAGSHPYAPSFFYSDIHLFFV